MTIREKLEELKGQYTDYTIIESCHPDVNRIVNDCFYKANSRIVYDEDLLDDESYELLDYDIMDWEEYNTYFGVDFEPDEDDKTLCILIREKPWTEEYDEEEE